jgi:hypothetical protein
VDDKGVDGAGLAGLKCPVVTGKARAPGGATELVSPAI